MFDDVLQPNVFVLVFVLYWLIDWLSKHRDSDDIAGFRRQSLRYHPERLSLQPNDDDATTSTDSTNNEASDESLRRNFSLVAESYDVLSDPFKRAVYDQYGETGLKINQRSTRDDCVPPYVFHGEPLRTYREFFGTDNPYADLLDYGLSKPPLLGRCPEARGTKIKDKDDVRPLVLTLDDVFYGGVKKIRIKRSIIDTTGDGKTTKMTEKILSVPIMPGMPKGARIVFNGEGDQGPLKIPADIVFVTDDAPHEYFRRDGTNLRMTVDLFLREALTGTIITVNTIDERVLRVPIDEVISPSYVKLVEGEGLPLVDDPERRGDLLIDFNIEFPAYLPASSKSLVKRALDPSLDHVDENEDERGNDFNVPWLMQLDGKLYTRANKIEHLCRS